MVVRHGILREDEVHVVGTDVLHAELGGQLQQRLVHPQLVLVDIRILLRVARGMQLQFEVIVVAEDPLEPLHHALGLLHVVVHDGLGHLAAQTCRAADQPFVVLFEQLLVDARLVIEPLGKRVGDHLAEVVVAFEVLGQQDQVVAGLLVLVLLETVFHHVDLTAEDRLHPGVRSGVVEILDTVHIAVVGDGDSIHPQRFGAFDERLDGRGAVEDRILGMYVQMDEFRHGRNSSNLSHNKDRDISAEFMAGLLHFINKIPNFRYPTKTERLCKTKPWLYWRNTTPSQKPRSRNPCSTAQGSGR